MPVRLSSQTASAVAQPMLIYRMPARRSALLLSTALAGLVVVAPVWANPQGGTVAAGSAAIVQTTPNRLDINQSTDKAVIDWRSFSIPAGNQTNFNQPSANSMTLNRVNGADPSTIAGKLTANGAILLINPNGVLFDRGSRVDVGGLIASTSNINNADFMAGKLVFSGKAIANSASIVNRGDITVREGGLVAFVGPTVANSGVINARLGKVSLVGAESFTIDMYGDKLVQIAVDDQVAKQMLSPDGEALTAVVSNTGKISADGGVVQLSVKAAASLVDRAINMTGVIEARGVTQIAGKIVLDGGSGNVDVSGKLDASSATGKGGSVSVAGGIVAQSGVLDASGAAGGDVSLAGRTLLDSGTISATGSVTTGGTITATATGHYIGVAASSQTADGATDGGAVRVQSTGAKVFSSGTTSARGALGKGGRIELLAPEIVLAAANLDASGAAKGGDVRIGGDYQGVGSLPKADLVTVTPSTTIKASALRQGDGGQIVVWSEQETKGYGTYQATGVGAGSTGGLIEVSSKGLLTWGGAGDASAAGGTAGKLLLDPKNITIDDTTGQGLVSFDLQNPGTNNSEFGNAVVVLSNGNIVVVNRLDSINATFNGAAYLYSGATGSLISALTGTAAYDQVGSGSVSTLSNGGYVVMSPNWYNGTAGAAGAVTWGNGSSALTGSVSAANSLVGTSTNDYVGNWGITTLSNGGYVVRSTIWRNNVTGAANAGAVTWGSGTSALIGSVSAANSLVGTTVGDSVGDVGVITLSNGGYVVQSASWRNDVTGAAAAGAVTWGSGTSALTGSVSAANSLVGTSASDQVGSITTLSNGAYVVVSSNWRNGVTGAAAAGAVTWGSGTSALIGSVSSANSLVGTSANDRVGSSGVTALSNGGYVVGSYTWRNGVTGAANAGAVTWSSGTSALTGSVSVANSLVGTTVGDFVGNSVTALSNGGYVVRSFQWDSGTVTDVGAVTWGSGTSALIGSVSSANSLVGTSTNDRVGFSGVTALTNGGYIVRSKNWANGTMTNAGAVTWGSGTSALFGSVSSANSLVGTSTNDYVGGDGGTALSNGGYVVISKNWNNNGVANAGAVTWGSGTSALIGSVSAVNSLVGTSANDQVGAAGVTALSNGGFVVRSYLWNNNGAATAGAVTWGSGTSALTGSVSTANSLVGTSAGDYVGNNQVTALNNGGYVVISTGWRNNGAANAGAVTWGSGTSALIGAVSATNSLVGTSTNDYVGVDGVKALSNGGYVIGSQYWQNNGVSNTGAVTWGSGTSALTGSVSAANSFVGIAGSTYFLGYKGALPGNAGLVAATGGRVSVGLFDPNSATFSSYAPQSVTLHSGVLTRSLTTGTNVTLQASNDITVNSAVTVSGSTGGNLTLQAGRSVLLNAGITTANGNLTIIANETVANGVVNAQRDVGNALITMASGASINAGTGTVSITLRNSTDKTNNAAGAITLRSITAGQIDVRNLATGAGTDVSLATGAVLTASGTGNALTLATGGASGGNFVNNAGSSALSAASGRWLVYSNTPVNDTKGGLVAGDKRYGRNITSNAPGTVAETGNLYLYAVTPTVTVTAADATRQYGDANPAFAAGTITGFIDGDTAGTALTGAASFSTTASATTGVGTSAITGAAGTLVSPLGYQLAFANGTLTITKAPLTITPNAASRVYGDADPAFSATYSGLKNSETGATAVSGLTIASNSLVTSDVGSYQISANGGTSNNYTLSYGAPATLTVTQAPLTITPNSVSRTYGGSNALTATYTGLKNSDASTVVNGLSLTTAATAASDVGTYSISASGGTATNYAITLGANATLTVNPAPLTITANGATRTYGAANPTFTASYSGFVNSDTSTVVSNLTLATPATTTSNVGSYAINASGATASNYAITYASGTLSVTPAPLTITSNGATRTYGAANPTFTASYSGFVNGETSTLVSGLSLTTSATNISDVGSYAINGAGASAANYAITYAPGTLSVTPAPLTITANGATRTYGSADPTFTASYAGFVNGQTSAVVSNLALASTATITSNVGSYAINGSGATASNYAITYAPGALTVTQASLTITPDSVGRTYGSANALTATYTGLRNTDTSSVVTGLTLATPATAASNVGTYAISASGGAATNYAITLGANATLTVNPAPLTVTADNKSREIGAANPVLTGTGVGLVNGETLASLGFSFSTTANAASPIGNYVISVAGTATNYTVTSVNGQLSVVAAAPVVVSTPTTTTPTNPTPTIPTFVTPTVVPTPVTPITPVTQQTPPTVVAVTQSPTVVPSLIGSTLGTPSASSGTVAGSGTGTGTTQPSTLESRFLINTPLIIRGVNETTRTFGSLSVSVAPGGFTSIRDAILALTTGSGTPSNIFQQSLSLGSGEGLPDAAAQEQLRSLWSRFSGDGR